MENSLNKEFKKLKNANNMELPIERQVWDLHLSTSFLAEAGMQQVDKFVCISA